MYVNKPHINKHY